MTRREKLIAMNGQTLIKVADKLGVKVACNRTRTALKEAKSNVVERILKAENVSEDENICADGTKYSEIGKEIADQAKKKAEEAKKKPADKPKPLGKKAKASLEADQKLSEKPKHGGLIEYNGKSQTISEWSRELNKPIQTLYGRLYILGWPVEKAFTK